MIRRTPSLLHYSAEELIAKAEGARKILDLKPPELYMLLRKNPILMIMDTDIAKARLNKLHHVTPLDHQSSRHMVIKYPLVLNLETETIEALMGRLRNLAYTRAMWQQDFDNITSSLLAFFIRDRHDLLLRLEFLALTGECPMWCLREVFKPSNNLFARKNRGYRPWLHMRAVRKQRLLERAKASQRAAGSENPADDSFR
ncbi:hypothetical protein CEUSTIGMA_g7573.t1 [Chlamydomonas eustigma]|uniref:Uncharacterized protein n=1 Tax=Chlamydomonas eustigma TaxID=1157962 RepID=A0A250XAK4_9CHLO|nr:hypothetical protein CEUSTIGMA_g7573.t1 [Chlamydomonas eustigma]|eukprot:GAX80135.1 hypothetical protein CEUSTIGMA_g7573.t1 [Chlamydomonas eustigma]